MSLCHTFCEAVSESEACWSLKVGVNQFQGKELYLKETIYHSLNFVNNTLNLLTLCFLCQLVMFQLRHQDLTYLALPLFSPTPLFVSNIVEPYE